MAQGSVVFLSLFFGGVFLQDENFKITGIWFSKTLEFFFRWTSGNQTQLSPLLLGKLLFRILYPFLNSYGRTYVVLKEIVCCSCQASHWQAGCVAQEVGAVQSLATKIQQQLLVSKIFVFCPPKLGTWSNLTCTMCVFKCVAQPAWNKYTFVKLIRGII